MCLVAMAASPTHVASTVATAADIAPPALDGVLRPGFSLSPGSSTASFSSTQSPSIPSSSGSLPPAKPPATLTQGSKPEELFLRPSEQREERSAQRMAPYRTLARNGDTGCKTLSGVATEACVQLQQQPWPELEMVTVSTAFSSTEFHRIEMESLERYANDMDDMGSQLLSSITPFEPCYGGSVREKCATYSTRRSVGSFVTLHVYDFHTLTRMLGIPIFHLAVEVHGKEYFFSQEGIVWCPPAGHALHVHKKAIPMGKTLLNASEVRALLEVLCCEWPASEYSIFGRNCQTFAGVYVERMGADGKVPSEYLMHESLPGFAGDSRSGFFPGCRVDPRYFKGGCCCSMPGFTLDAEDSVEYIHKDTGPFRFTSMVSSTRFGPSDSLVLPEVSEDGLDLTERAWKLDVDGHHMIP